MTREAIQVIAIEPFGDHVSRRDGTRSPVAAREKARSVVRIITIPLSVVLGLVEHQTLTTSVRHIPYFCPQRIGRSVVRERPHPNRAWAAR
jgi:hypothetical protein